MLDLNPLTGLSPQFRALEHRIAGLETIELDLCLTATAMQRAFTRLLMLEQYLSVLRRAECVCFLQRLTLCGRRPTKGTRVEMA
ncbi:hypothetical protein [Paraburkholderia sp. BR14262]|uniref:hypothetical protein n=1 Tax=Paraburkholderia sp. BR14262 TaxID=3236999 RepID=UPI0034CE4422